MNHPVSDPLPFDAVLFDYSGVLTTSLHLPTEGVGYDPDAVLTEMIVALSSSEPHPWHELERGEITLVAYVDQVEVKVPGAGVLFAADSDLNVMAELRLRAERIAIAAAVKAQGFRVGLLTNNVLEWQPHWLPRLPAGLFEVVIDSSAVGLRKPEPEIYQLAMRALDCDNPSRVLFIDDFEWNVTGAIDVGMQGLHCPVDLDLAAALVSWGVLKH